MDRDSSDWLMWRERRRRCGASSTKERPQQLKSFVFGQKYFIPYRVIIIIIYATCYSAAGHTAMETEEVQWKSPKVKTHIQTNDAIKSAFGFVNNLIIIIIIIKCISQSVVGVIR